MVSTSYTFRLDPFAADYDAAIQLSEAEEPSAGVDVTVERADWEPVRPQASRAQAVDRSQVQQRAQQIDRSGVQRDWQNRQQGRQRETSPQRQSRPPSARPQSRPMPSRSMPQRRR